MQQLKMLERRIIATFIPESYMNDIAVEIDGRRREIDVTDKVLALTALEIGNIADRAETSDFLVVGSSLGHYGPYSIEVAQSVQDFFGVKDLSSDITEEMVAAARTTHRVSVGRKLPEKRIVVTLQPQSWRYKRQGNFLNKISVSSPGRQLLDVTERVLALSLEEIRSLEYVDSDDFESADCRAFDTLIDFRALGLSADDFYLEGLTEQIGEFFNVDQFEEITEDHLATARAALSVAQTKAGEMPEPAAKLASDFEALFCRERARANEERSRAERLEEWAGDAQHTIGKLRHALEIIAVGDAADAKAAAREALAKSGMWTKQDPEHKPSTPSFDM